MMSVEGPQVKLGRGGKERGWLAQACPERLGRQMADDGKVRVIQTERQDHSGLHLEAAAQRERNLGSFRERVAMGLDRVG